MAVDLGDLSIRQLREMLLSRDGTVPAQTLAVLRRDSRRGAQELARQLDARAAAARRERLRIHRLQRDERRLRSAGMRYVAGVDEVGIGPLAGPVVAAAIVFEAGAQITGIDDSKRLDATERSALATEVRSRALGVGIGVASVEEIDSINVYHAGLLAMRRAVEALPMAPHYILVDARTIPDVAVPQRAVIQGDAQCFSIAAASIVAKTYRDQLMTDLDAEYPQYGFCRHKGYATAEHQAAIRRHGPCELHRKSYTFLKELRGQYSRQFYELRERLVGKPDPTVLREVAVQCERGTGGLSDPERKKLRVLIARREALL